MKKYRITTQAAVKDLQSRPGTRRYRLHQAIQLAANSRRIYSTAELRRLIGSAFMIAGMDQRRDLEKYKTRRLQRYIQTGTFQEV